MKKLIWNYFRHSALQYRFMRKWFKGTYYLVRTNLPMQAFWVEHDTKMNINSCQGKIIRIEVYTENGLNPESYDSFDRQHLFLYHSADEETLTINDKDMVCRCHGINFTKNSISEINNKLG